jgi:hypothetical protein
MYWTTEFWTSKTSVEAFIRLGLLFVLAPLFFSLLGVPPISSLLVITVLAVVTVFGQVVLSWVGFRNLPMGVALVLGIGTLVFLTQFMLIADAPMWATHWGSITFMAIGTAWIWRSTNEYPFQVSINQVEHLEIAFAIAVFALTARQPWIFPFGCSLAFILYGSRLLRLKPWVLFAVTPTVAGGVWLSRQLRVENWWYYYQGNDAQFFEALSWSTSQWGVFEHPGLVGGSIAEYHWLTYAFFGSLSHLAGLTPWTSLMKIGPFLLAFGFASIFLVVISKRDDSLQALRWSIVALCVIVMPGTRVDSFAFSILIAMAFVISATEASKGTSQLRRLVVFSLLAPTLLFGKVSTAAVVGVVLATAWLVARVKGEDLSSLPILVLSAFTLILVAVNFSNNAGSSQVATISPSLTASLTELRGLLDFPNFTLQFCLWLIAVLLGKKVAGVNLNSLHYALLVSTPVLIVGWILQASGTSMYFGTPAMYLLTLVFAGRTDWQASSSPLRRHQVGTLLIFMIALLAGFYNSTLLDRFDRILGIAEWTGDYFWEIIRGSGYIFLACLVVAVLASVFRSRSRLLVAPIVTTLLAFTTGSTLDVFRRVHAIGPSEYENSGGNSAPFANNDLKDLGTWIRDNTNLEVILAANNFCCAGNEWWQAIALEPSQHLREASGETKWGGANYLLPAETRRRFLVQGLRFQTGYGEPTPDQIARVSVSLRFANSPSLEVVEKLRLYGVSGYVVNLALTEHRDWSPFAVEKFRSGDFVYLELK